MAAVLTVGYVRGLSHVDLMIGVVLFIAVAAFELVDQKWPNFSSSILAIKLFVCAGLLTLGLAFLNQGGLYLVILALGTGALSLRKSKPK